MDDTTQPVKAFLKKPMVDTTVGDHLILHGGMLLVTLAVTATVQIFGTVLIKMAGK